MIAGKPTPTPADQSFSFENLGRVASAEEGYRPFAGTVFESMPWLAGVQSFIYAHAAAAAERARDGVPHAPVQWLSISGSAAANQNKPPSEISLPIPFLHPRFSAEQCNLIPLPQPYSPLSTDPSPAGVTLQSDTTTQILEDLRQLASWPRLRNLTLLDPIVGGLESDPAGIADRLGVKGLSVYTAFIHMEYLRCRVCGHQSSETALAILHQRHRRHFQS